MGFYSDLDLNKLTALKKIFNHFLLIKKLRKPISFMFKIKFTSSYLVITRKLSPNYEKKSRNYEKRPRNYEKRPRNYEKRSRNYEKIIS